MKRALSRQQKMTIVFGILSIVVIIVVLQLWLLTATMNAFLAGQERVVIPAALLKEVVEEAAAQEKLEAWIIAQVQAGAALPGLYPPNAETKARYEAFLNAQATAVK